MGTPSREMLRKRNRENRRSMPLTNPYAKNMAGLGVIEGRFLDTTKAEFQDPEPGDFIQPKSGLVPPKSANACLTNIPIDPGLSGITGTNTVGFILMAVAAYMATKVKW